MLYVHLKLSGNMRLLKTLISSLSILSGGKEDEKNGVSLNLIVCLGTTEGGKNNQKGKIPC